MTETTNAIRGDIPADAREVASTPAAPWATPPAAGAATAPGTRPLAEPRFASFYGVRQLGTSAYATPIPGSDSTRTSPTRGKPVRPFRVKLGGPPRNITASSAH